MIYERGFIKDVAAKSGVSETAIRYDLRKGYLPYTLYPPSPDQIRDWLPNVGLALVAVSVEPRLSQEDVELLEHLH